METLSGLPALIFIFIVCSETAARSAVNNDQFLKSLKLKRSLPNHAPHKDDGFDPKVHNDYDRVGYVPVYYSSDAYSHDPHDSDEHHQEKTIHHDSDEHKSHPQYAPKYIHVFDASGHKDEGYPYKGSYHVTYGLNGHDRRKFISNRVGYAHSGYPGKGHTLPEPRHSAHQFEGPVYDHPIFRPLGYEHFLEAHNAFRLGNDHDKHGAHDHHGYDDHHKGYDKHHHENDDDHIGYDQYNSYDQHNSYEHNGYDDRRYRHNGHGDHHHVYDDHHSGHNDHHNGYDAHHSGYDNYHHDYHNGHDDHHNGHDNHHNGHDDHKATSFAHHNHDHAQDKPHHDHSATDDYHGDDDSASYEHRPKHFAFEDHLKKGFGHGIFAKYAKKYGYLQHATDDGH